MSSTSRLLLSGILRQAERRASQFTRRALSTAPAFAIQIDQSIPFKHSRKKRPPVCTDLQLLQELTEQVLTAPVGSIFKFSERFPNQVAIAAASDESWLQADAAVQEVEFLMRGHARCVKGTRWNEWIVANDDNSLEAAGSPEQAVQTMMALTDRMYEEGQKYMVLRAARLEELFGPKDLGAGEQVALLGEKGKQVVRGTDNMKTQIEAFAKSERMLEGSDGEEEEEAFEHEFDEHIQQPATYMNDFALPGPTVNMYDTLLDALAASAHDGVVASPADTANDVFHDIMGRHILDGGDLSNTNVHTRPTLMSFNAAIRVAATQSFDQTDKNPANIERRDQALLVAFGCFGALSESKILERNSATYCYLLQVVAKYFPASRIRGNVAKGMWHHACTQGLIDQSVMDAFVSANEPSNGPVFDNWLQQNIKGKTKKDLPHTKWVRHSRSRRYQANEATY
jgi:hypothetical protein